MVAIAVLGAIGLTVVLFVAGYTSTADASPFTISTSGAADCATACANWLRMRDQTRGLAAAVARAQAAHDATLKEYWAVVGAVFALVAAAAVAAGVPIVGPLLVLAVLASVAALVLYSVALLGQLAGLLQNLRNAQSALGNATKFEADALSEMRAACPEDEVAKCMARP
jgi:hypothetical protein